MYPPFLVYFIPRADPGTLGFFWDQKMNRACKGKGEDLVMVLVVVLGSGAGSGSGHCLVLVLGLRARG